MTRSYRSTGTSAGPQSTFGLVKRPTRFRLHYSQGKPINQESFGLGRTFCSEVLHCCNMRCSCSPAASHTRAHTTSALPPRCGLLASRKRITEARDSLQPLIVAGPAPRRTGRNEWNVVQKRPSTPTRRTRREMSTFQDTAYTVAAISATVALFRSLVGKGVLTREEAVRAILDEAVARAIQAEAEFAGRRHQPPVRGDSQVHRREAVRSGLAAYRSLPSRRAPPSGCSANCRPMRRSSVT